VQGPEFKPQYTKKKKKLKEGIKTPSVKANMKM
jgi:hypothetical protein